jgi:hypothetical protein
MRRRSDIVCFDDGFHLSRPLLVWCGFPIALPASEYYPSADRAGSESTHCETEPARRELGGDQRHDVSKMFDRASYADGCVSTSSIGCAVFAIVQRYYGFDRV